MSRPIARYTGSRKEADARLDAGLESAWSGIRSAAGRRHAAELMMRGLGLSVAVLLPLVGLLSSTGDPVPQGGDIVTIATSVDEATAAVEPSIFKPTIKVYAGVLDADSPTELVVGIVPPSKLWHRSAFEEIDDQLWALPDARFKMTLSASGGNCRGADCTAEFSLEGLPGFATMGVEAGRIRLGNAVPVGGDEAAADCGVSDSDASRPHFVHCMLRESAAAETGICMLIRRAMEAELDEEMVALDIRWEEDVASCP